MPSTHNTRNPFVSEDAGVPLDDGYSPEQRKAIADEFARRCPKNASFSARIYAKRQAIAAVISGNMKSAPKLAKRKGKLSSAAIYARLRALHSESAK